MGQDQDSQPAETPGPQPEAALSGAPPRGRSIWRRLSALRSTLTILRKLIVDMAVVGSAVAVIAVFVLMVTDDTIVIEAPSVPKPVSDRGLTPELLTELLQARVYEIRDDAESSKSTETAGPGLETISIQTAGLNFSLNSLALMARRLVGIGRERVLKMRIICPTPDCSDDVLVLHAVSHAGDAVLNTATPLDMDDLGQAIDVASSHFLLSFDPHLLGVYHLRQGKLAHAKDIARKMVLEWHPQVIWAYNLLGIIKMRCGHYDVAKAYFDQALKMDRKFAPAIVNIGAIHVQKNESTSAIAAYKRALAADPDNVIAHLNLGKISIKGGDWVEATAAYERAFEIDPGVSSVLIGLAEIKTYGGDAAAAASLKQLVEPSDTLNSLDKVIKHSSYCGSGN